MLPAFRVIMNSLHMGNLRCLDSCMAELGELIKTQREQSEWTLMRFVFTERCSNLDCLTLDLDAGVPQRVRDLNRSGKKNCGKTALTEICYSKGNPSVA